MALETRQFVDYLRGEIRAQMNDYADDIAGGGCASYDAYKELCGVIRGLAITERLLLDLAQKAENDD